MMIPTYQPQSANDEIRKKVSKRNIKVLSILQLLCGALAVITQIIALSNQQFSREWGVVIMGTGLWTGLFFGITGLVGLFTSQKPSKCK